MDTSQLAHPKQKGLSKKAKRSREHSLRKLLRDHIWERDGGRSRASGQTLWRDHCLHDCRGEVAHIQSRGSEPSRKMDPTNCLLLSAYEHVLSDGRGGYRLKLTDPLTGEPALDATKPIKFTLYRKDGSVEWERVS